jgi:putative membrane protein
MLSLTDRLAVMRTALANERTLLAYVRTALALGAAGAGLVSLFTTRSLRTLGWALIPIGAAVLVAGVARFANARRALRALAPPERGG